MRSNVFVSAPGKILLFGEHAVVYGKKAIAASLDLRTRGLFELVPNELEDSISSYVGVTFPNCRRKWLWEEIRSALDGPEISMGSELLSKRINVRKACDLMQFGNAERVDSLCEGEGSLRVITFFLLAMVVYTAQQKVLADSEENEKDLDPLQVWNEVQGLQMPSLHIEITTDLPIGAGLGSSASFGVCVAAALLSLYTNLDVFDGGMDVQDFHGNECIRPSQDHLEIINKWAFEAERVLHGTPSGVDNTVSTFGGALVYSHSGTLLLEKLPPIRLLVTNTHVARNTKTLVSNVRERRNNFPTIVDSILSGIDEISGRCFELFNLQASKDSSPVINGDDASSIPQAPTGISTKQLSLRALLSEIEILIEMNQSLLNALGVGHPVLERIRGITAEFRLPTKLTGAGGGGCSITLVPSDVDEEIVRQARSRLEVEGFSVFEGSIGGAGVLLSTNRAHFDNSS